MKPEICLIEITKTLRLQNINGKKCPEKLVFTQIGKHSEIIRVKGKKKLILSAWEIKNMPYQVLKKIAVESFGLCQITSPDQDSKFWLKRLKWLEDNQQPMKLAF
jgi:hypothetical protein